MNDPIRGLGRLRRIGISFSKEQKELITTLAESGDILGAQTEIIRELEFELGNVSRAMGESSLGIIKKYQTAWTNLKEELGETVTTLRGELIETLGLTGKIAEITDKFAQTNASGKFKGLIDRDALMGDVGAVQTSAKEIENAYAGMLSQVDRLNSTLEKEEGRFFKDKEYIGILEEEKASYYEYIDALLAFSRAYQKVEDQKRASADDPTIDTGPSADALKWLEELKRVETQKRKILTLDELSKKTSSAVFSREQQYRSLVEEGVKLGLERNDLQILLNKYSNEYEESLTEQERIARALLITEQTRSDIDLYGTTEQKKLQEYNDTLLAVDEAYLRGNISLGQAQKIIADINKETTEIAETPQSGFMEGLIGQFDTATERALLFNDTMKEIGDQVLNIGISALTESLTFLGASMAGVGDEADTWEQTMLKIIASSLTAIGPNLMLAGALALAEPGGWRNPVGWALLAAGGAASIGGGYLSQSIANASEGGATDSVNSSSAIQYTDVETPKEFASTGDRGIQVQNNIVNNTGSNVTTNSRTVNGRVVVETVIDSATKATANKYALQQGGRNVS